MGLHVQDLASQSRVLWIQGVAVDYSFTPHPTPPPAQGPESVFHNTHDV